MKKHIKYLTFYISAFVLCTAIFASLFRTPLFAGNHVYFYRALSLLFVTGTILSTIIFVFAKYNKSIKLITQDIIIAIFIPLCLNVAFLSLVTVSIDRSISVFILSYMAENKNKAFTKKEIDTVFYDVYMNKYEAMKRRFDEQLITGSIREKQNTFQITPKGIFLINCFRLVAKVFPIDNRFLYPERYTSDVNVE